MLAEKEEQYADHQQERKESEEGIFKIVRRAVISGLALHQCLEVIRQNRNGNRHRKWRGFERLAAGVHRRDHVGDHLAGADHYRFTAVGLGKDAQWVFKIIHLDLTKRLGLAQIGNRNRLHRITTRLGSSGGKSFHADLLTKDLLHLLTLEIEVEHHAEV